jgi:hypothetical protein
MNNNQYSRKCPKCENDIFHTELNNCNYARKICRPCKSCGNREKKHSDESKMKMAVAKLGKRLSESHIKNISKSLKNIKKSPHTEKAKKNMSLAKRPPITEETKRKLSVSAKNAWKKPEIRDKYHTSIEKTKWLKVRTDIGQLELLNKWNKLGLEFEPNYQLKTNNELYYIDGYDKKHNIVFEYDSLYHNKHSQIQKDLIRQSNIINTLKPKLFWRFNKKTNSFSECINGKTITTINNINTKQGETSDGRFIKLK